jgi:hypothetical protein
MQVLTNHLNFGRLQSSFEIRLNACCHAPNSPAFNFRTGTISPLTDQPRHPTPLPASIGLLLEIWMRPMQDTRTRSLPLCFIPQLGWHARHPYFACSSRRSWRPMREISWTTCCWYISLSPCLQFLGHKFVVFSIINIIVDSFVYVVMDTCLITKVLHSVGDCKKASCCGDNISRENEQYIYESS